MNIDVRTLIFVLGITHLIQVAVFTHQSLTNKNFRGINWWLAWSATETVGFTFMLMRSIPSFLTTAIIVQNATLILGVIFLYIGIARFFDNKEKRPLVISIFSVYLAAILYFLFANNNINARGAVISFGLASVSFLSAWTLNVSKTRAVSSSANFIILVFIAHGAYHLLRALAIIAGAPADNFFASMPINVTAYLDAIVVGNLVTFGCIIMINQRLNAEMTEAREEMELVFDTSPDAAVITRLSDGLIVYANEGFYRLSGFTKAEAIGKSILDLNIWKNPDDRKHIVNELRAKGFCNNFEASFQRKDGRQFVGLMSANVIDLQYAPHIISVTRDITDRKRIETDRLEIEAQSQQLQKAESLGRMAGAIAHQFNNQLQAIMGGLELAVEEQSRGKDCMATLDVIMQATHRAAEISRLMLTYIGKTHVKLEIVDISDVCRRNLPLIQAAIPKRVALETDLPPRGPNAMANADQIQQILTNLVANAWEAYGDGPGIIRLRLKTVAAADIPSAHRFPLDWQPQDNACYACLEVEDKGAGIAENDIGKIFDPFFSTKFTGRGMGLSVVFGIVRAHNGCIAVESKAGQGARFRIYLPAIAEGAPCQIDKAAKAPASSGTVLMIDDDQMVRNLTAAMLAHLGYTVLDAVDGVDAVEQFRRHKDEICCVLCDLIMPRMDGWETLAALRALRPDLPAILISGYDEAHAMAGDHPEQPQAFLGKPYTRKEISEALDKALKERPSGKP